MRLHLQLAALTLLVSTIPLRAQTIGQNKSPDDPVTVTLNARSQLVVEAVTVKDKAGNTIPGLTAEDFTLTEDGVPQKIRFCEHESLPITAAPLPRTPPAEENLTLYKRLSRSQITPEGDQDIR